MNETRETILSKASDLLKEWDGKVNELEGQLNEAKENTQAEITKLIDDLKGKRDELQSKLQEWQSKGGEALSEIQKEFERLGGEVAKTFNTVVDKVKKLFEQQGGPSQG